MADLAQLEAHQGWLIGLLHNLGSPVSAAHAPHEYDASCTGLAGSSAQVQDAERSAFGYDHTDMGGILIEDLPWMPSLGVAMAHHHRADASKPPALAAGAAGTIAHQLGFDMGLANTPPELGQTEMVRFALVGPELDKVVGMVMSAVSVYDQTP